MTGVGKFDGSTATALGVGTVVLEALAEHAKDGRPLEVCGVLFGAYDDEGVAKVDGCAALANVSSTPEHEYRMDPDQQAQVWDRVRAMGLEVLAVWHTHPAGPIGPSETDLEYMQPWLLYPVLSFDPLTSGARWQLHVYRLGEDGEAVEVPVLFQMLPPPPVV